MRKTTPSVCQPRPRGTLPSAAGAAGPGARGMPTGCPSPALPRHTTAHSKTNSLPCQGVCPQDCSASVWDPQHRPQELRTPLDQTVPFHPTPVPVIVSSRICVPAAPPFLPLLSGVLFISLSVYSFSSFPVVERLKSVAPH